MKNKAYKISLLSLIIVCSANTVAHARVNVRNYPNKSYNQMIAAQQQAIAANTNVYATTASATETLPIAVDDPELAKSVLNNSSNMVNTNDLENCSMIYPNGLFKWAVPESGVRKNPVSQCVAVVELRDANTNAVLAQTTLASGDVMKCNIDMFPQSGWQSGLANVELPADDAPTIADVEKVMDQEQKQNAGIKIAAGAILAGLAGNMLAPKEAGDTRLLGTSNAQLVDTAIGAATGAGIMAASTYSGKVAGDTIKSTAVNAAAGAVVGNMAGGMAGGGETTLTIKKCSIKDANGTTMGEYDCIAGNIDRVTVDSEGISGGKDKSGNIYLIDRSGRVKRCTACKGESCGNLSDSGQRYDCRDAVSNLLKIQLSGNPNDTYANVVTAKNRSYVTPTIYRVTDDNEFMLDTIDSTKATESHYFLVYSASFSSGRTEHGYAVFKSGLPKKVFGYKLKDWEEIRVKNPVEYYARNRDGSVGPARTVNIDDEGKATEEIVFAPLGVDADDDTLVDFSNAGRMKSTLTGAAAGGALGGFSAYQGAKQEVQERYLSAIREYNDSLTNFYCATGTRFLSQYNDYIEIPLAQKFE